MVDDKKLDFDFSDGKVIGFSLVVLLVVVYLGVTMAYEVGFSVAGNRVCNPLSFGVTLDGDYVCFNESYNVNSNLYYHDFNVSLEGLE